MSTHPAISAGNVAVITGGADGIGLAAARYFHAQGMKLVLADVNGETLAAAVAQLPGAIGVETDVASAQSVESLRSRAYEAFGQVDVLMNNAGTAAHSTPWTEPEAWRKTLEINLWGVINGVQAFVPAMLEQGTVGLIINTGSKQGITTPPGNPAYNVSKAGIKALTEALQHELRNTEGCKLSAHLLVPGFTYTGMIRQFLPEKPDGAWTAEQVVEYMVSAIDGGKFYIICPDNDTTEDMDKKRMAWAMGDLIEGRPPLSRWHPDYADDFACHMQDD